ncbi:MAG: competence protein CoiA [Sporolactobacillus sp.]
MLVSIRKDRRVLSLAVKLPDEEELLQLRKERFFCPVCHQPVRLKYGSKKRAHFAHYPNSQCRVESEPESERHLTGKADLYGWALRKGRHAELEYYFKSLRQRPDILLTGIEPMVIEYQCSAITEETLCSRTKGYLGRGITPVWVLGNNNYQQKGGRIKLSGFATAAIQYVSGSCSSDGDPFVSFYSLCFYDPANKQFIFSVHLSPCSKTSFISQEIVRPLDRVQPFQLLHPHFPQALERKLFKQKWLTIKKKQRLFFNRFRGMEEDWLRKQAYSFQHQPAYFPPYAGIPHEHFIWLQNPPYLWQTWIVYLLQEAVKEGLSSEQIIQLTKLRGGERLFLLRHLPLMPPIELSRLLEIYLDQLVSLRIVLKRDERYFFRGRDIDQYQSMSCLFEQDEELLNALDVQHSPISGK